MVVSGMMGNPADQMPLATTSAEVILIEQNQSSSGLKKQPVVDLNQGIEDEVKEYFKDYPVLADIAYCESRYRQFDNKTGEVFRGKENNKDVGILQVNEYYHKERATKLGFNLHTKEGNMGYAKLLYLEKGAQPWSASSPCWKKTAEGAKHYERIVASR
jgi:hypothetical protein